MYPILFKIGPLTIYTYGVMVFLGVVIAYWLAVKEALRRGINKDIFSNIFFWSVVCGFLTARILYAIVEWRYFLNYPVEVLFGRSGFVFFGGIIGGTAAFSLLVKRYKISFLTIADIFALYLPLAHGIGRLGCFFYGCCYGKVTSSWIGLHFPQGSPAGIVGAKVIPTQIISAFFLAVIFFILFFMNKKKSYGGRIAVCYLLLYGIFRFIIEFFRGDPRGFIGALSISQWIAIFGVLTGVYLWIRLRRSKKKVTG